MPGSWSGVNSSARIRAATWNLLTLIREFDTQDGWSGCLSCAHWLTWRTALAPGASREHVRVARAPGDLPKLSDAMRLGRISYSKVRAVTRVATRWIARAESSAPPPRSA